MTILCNLLGSKRQYRSVCYQLLGIIVCSCALEGLPIFAQTRAPHEYTPPPSSTNGAMPGRVLLTPEEDYRLAPGDSIDVAIEDAPEISRSCRLSAAGDFELPVLGVIKAQGQTAPELAKVIAEGLRRERYLKQPIVKVTVVQFTSQYYFIQGAIKQPGIYQTEGRPSLVKLISLAGGLMDNHGPTALILRPRKSAKEPATINSATNSVSHKDAAQQKEADNDLYDVIKVSLSAIYQQGHFDQNFKIEPGDIVEIPPANVFYVAGEVTAPGVFQMKEGTTLRQAIALAQGTTFKAKLGEGIIFRDDLQTGRRMEIRIDIRQIMDGKKEDMVIQPNDVIIVPNSRVKSVTSALLTALGVNSARIPMRY